jgi:hypothetical protein
MTEFRTFSRLSYSHTGKRNSHAHGPATVLNKVLQTPVSGEERKRRVQERIYGIVSRVTFFPLRLFICTAAGSTQNQ